MHLILVVIFLSEKQMSELSNFEKLKHLFWRAGFGPGLEIFSEQYSIEQAVDLFFEDAINFTPFTLNNTVSTETLINRYSMDEMDPKFMNTLDSAKMQQVALDWFNLITNCKFGLREKMALFWNSHFPCWLKLADLGVDYVNLIRNHALGDFRTLLHEISKSPAMLNYLDNIFSTKKYPNENFAREFMELYSLGHGMYTEKDVREAARTFTGWTYDRITGDYYMNLEYHDFETKTFFGETSNLNGYELVELILNKKQCARYVVTKIYKSFVNVITNDKRIEELTDYFFDSNYDIKKLMKKIFLSDWFYSQESVGQKIKTPVELLAGIMKFYNMKFKYLSGFYSAQSKLHQVLFVPPSVAGWTFERGTIDGCTLMLRLNACNWLLNSNNFIAIDENDINPTLPEGKPSREIIYIKDNTHEKEKVFGAELNADHAKKLESFLIQPITKNYELSALYKTNSKKSLHEISLQLMSMPEYQFC